MIDKKAKAIVRFIGANKPIGYVDNMGNNKHGFSETMANSKTIVVAINPRSKYLKVFIVLGDFLMTI